MKKQLLSIMIIGMLAIGLLQVIATGLPLNALHQLVNTPLTLAQPAQAEPAQANAGQLTGEYTGQVKLQWSLSGVYSDTLATPAPPPAGSPAPPDLGAIDLALQLNHAGSAISGHIVLNNTLVFTREHTISVGGKPIDIGPTVQGSFDGVNLTVISEQTTLTVAGRSVQRQFRLTGAVTSADGRTLSGEYRETIWGYTPQPITAVGPFTLQWIGSGSVADTPLTGGNNKLYLPVIGR